jgi:hypothetical protein
MWLNNGLKHETHVQLSQENYVVTLVTKFNSACSHDNWRKFCNHLTSLNVQNFEIVKVICLEIMASRLPSMI